MGKDGRVAASPVSGLIDGVSIGHSAAMVFA